LIAIAAVLTRDGARALSRDLGLDVALGAAGMRGGGNGGAASGGTRSGSVAMNAIPRVFQVSSSFGPAGSRSGPDGSGRRSSRPARGGMSIEPRNVPDRFLRQWKMIGEKPPPFFLRRSR
jgi:hypothetical protein